MIQNVQIHNSPTVRTETEMKQGTSGHYPNAPGPEFFKNSKCTIIQFQGKIETGKRLTVQESVECKGEKT